MKIKLEQIDIDPGQIIAQRGLALGGASQKFLESQIIRRCIPYIPMEEGALADSGEPWPEPGGGYVRWGGPSAPYAHYQHEGEVYGPNIPILDEDGNVVGWWSPPVKQPTGKKLEYNSEKNPQAGDHWVERMMANEGDALLEDMAAYAGGKAGK